jgi:predicted phage terminase large subunit-like protein
MPGTQPRIVKGDDKLMAKLLLQRALLRQKELTHQETRMGFSEWLPIQEPKYTWTWNHLKYTQKYLQMLHDREIRRLFIALPPRHGKSEQGTIRFPAYALEQDPTEKVLIACHTSTLAKKFSRKTRAIVQARSVVNLDPKRQAVEEWLTKQGGGVWATGIPGNITGKGFTIICIDDPVKTREEVESLAIREKQWDWYTDDLDTRREPGCIELVQMTRWHEDDLGGRLLEDNPIGTDDEIIVITLPALYEGTDPADFIDEHGQPLRTEINQALCPERFTTDVLLMKKRRMKGSFDALYQQRPSPEEGDIFKKDWLERRANNFPTEHRLTQVWDTAMQKEERNDFSAMVQGCFDTESNTIYVAAMVNEKYEFPELKREMAKWRLLRNAEVAVEDKAAGISVAQDLRASGVPCILIPAGTKDKILRAKSITDWCASLMVVFVDCPGNINEFLINQLLMFPNGKRDDLVDAFVHLLRRLTGNARTWDEDDFDVIRKALDRNRAAGLRSGNRYA